MWRSPTRASTAPSIALSASRSNTAAAQNRSTRLVRLTVRIVPPVPLDAPCAVARGSAMRCGIRSLRGLAVDVLDGVVTRQALVRHQRVAVAEHGRTLDDAARAVGVGVPGL